MEQVLQHPQYVVLPRREGNVLGVIGMAVAFLGLFVPTGVVSLLGLMMCMAALGRAPRGAAIFGTILGLIGATFWLVITIAALLLAIVGVVVAGVGIAVAFMLTQPEVVEVTSDMVNVGIAAAAYEEEHDRPAEDIESLQLSLAMTTDPWGNPYRYHVTDDELRHDVASSGRDGLFGTPDDIRLSRLDKLWERAVDDFDDEMEQLGKRLEQLDGGTYGARWNGGCDETGRAYARVWQRR